MNRTVYVLLILLLCCLTGQAQHKDNLFHRMAIYGTNNRSARSIVRFNAKGELTTPLPSVLREGDSIDFKAPEDSSRLKYTAQLVKFETDIKTDYQSLTCKYPALKVLICNDDVAGCLSPHLRALKDSLNTLPPHSHYVKIDTLRNDQAKPESYTHKIRQFQLENILVVSWLKHTLPTYRGFRVDTSVADTTCQCNAKPRPVCQDGPTCNCDQEANFWNLFYQLNNARTSLTLEYNALLFDTDVTGYESDRIGIAIRQANTVNTQLQKLVRQVVNGNRDWLLSWLWYTKGAPMLNPFGTSDTTAQATYLRSRIAALSADVAAYEHSSANEGSLGIRRSQAMALQLARELTFLRARLAQLPALRKANQETMQNLSVKSRLLYEGELFVSTPERVIWMPQFDAAQNYRNTVAKQYPDQISEQDEMRPLVLNLETKQTVVLEETVTSIPNTTLFEQAVVAALGKVSGQVGTPTAGFMPGTPSDDKSLRLGAPSSITAVRDSLLASLKQTLDKIDATLTLANWLSQQSAPPSEIKPKDDDTAVYRSEWVKPKEPKAKNGSVEVTYGILEKTDSSEKVVIRNETYTQYELTRVSPAAGLVYHFKDRYASLFEDNSFSDQPFNQVDFVFGIKVYPFGKTNVQYKANTAKAYKLGKGYNYQRGNNWLNRVNLFVGTGTQKVFRNYYLGFGYDVTPFLQIQGGHNLYIQREHQFKNGTLIDSQDRLEGGGWYVSATLPIGVVTNLLKFINPF